MAAAAAAMRFKKLNFKPPVDVDAWDMEVLYMWWWWYWCTCYRASVFCLYYAHKMHSRMTFKPTKCASVKGGTLARHSHSYNIGGGGPDRLKFIICLKGQ